MVEKGKEEYSNFKIGGSIIGMHKDFLIKISKESDEVKVNLEIIDKDDKAVKYIRLDESPSLAASALSMSERLAVAALLRRARNAVEKNMEGSSGIIASKLSFIISKFE
ncbi:MAG: hypothetical protein ACP5RP_02435 [Candidatus Micrarchaeia archaeon]